MVPYVKAYLDKNEPGEEVGHEGHHHHVRKHEGHVPEAHACTGQREIYVTNPKISRISCNKYGFIRDMHEYHVP
jgi:hypothetical protein